ncbi:MAG: pyrroline-5-carboxylate reductase [Ignavibacteriales bacterium]
MSRKNIAILGGGNIGSAIAMGLAKSQLFPAESIIITRKNRESQFSHLQMGFDVLSTNLQAVRSSGIIILCVQPGQLNDLLEEIAPQIQKDHIIISVVSGALINDIKQRCNNKGVIVRAMPNTAISIRESMTCLTSDSEEGLETAKEIFDALGVSIVIPEELMVPATALCACGTAFFLRAVRAASQGGIEIGFHAEDALFMAAQTAKGAAALILNGRKHPEGEVDKVTTPRGCTISGLNEMEHHGFSSAMIKGITTAAEKAAKLYSPAE